MTIKIITQSGIGYAALMIYAMVGSISVAQVDTDPPIFSAVENGNAAVVKELLKANPAVIGLQDRYGKTPLHYAVCRNHIALTAYLLAQGASVKVRDNRGWTALHHAAENGSPEIAEILLRHDADVNALNSMQWTALHQAVLRGHTRVALCLVKHGADVEAKNSRQETAYNIAVDNGQLALKDFLSAQMFARTGISQSSTFAQK